MSQKLTVKEAAELLDYHPNHVRRLLRSGAIRGEKVAGAVWLIDRDEVERVKQEQSAAGIYYHGRT